MMHNIIGRCQRNPARYFFTEAARAVFSCATAATSFALDNGVLRC
jgi:hypothetical protein